ncbi:hypothetical protein PHMEG_00039419 [Phytophthora megakarya]|uniref:Uncharacterized protein n=1 Tax=Phytophthora megakarya TaxID=4795 RepID=A0A225UGY3_9STRA|nr:hypothetical protein PHMEG_00039419 [Phytophthora megakarya]
MEASAVSTTSPRSSTHVPVSTEQHVGAEDPSQNGEFDVLNSDCEDTETEICFVDDDEEIERTLRTNAEEESIFQDDEDEVTCIETGESEDEVDQCYGMERKTSTPSANTEEVTTGSQTETILPLAEVPVHESGEWNVLEKSDMVAFANGEENMEAMREDGWNLGKCVFDAEADNPVSYNMRYNMI